MARCRGGLWRQHTCGAVLWAADVASQHCHAPGVLPFINLTGGSVCALTLAHLLCASSLSVRSLCSSHLPSQLPLSGSV